MTLRWVLAIAALAAATSHPAAQEIPPYRAGQPGVTAPRLVQEVKPWYTAEAMRERATGSVSLTCVVQPDGTPDPCQVVAALHRDLDASALAAVRKWRFKPGTKDGVAVPVRVDIEMTFTLRDGPRRGFDAPGVFKKGDQGVVVPAVLHDVKPKYTADAMRERIEGDVVLECIVEADGSVGDIRIAKSLDPRLDGEAIAALKGWRFKPGTKDGIAVPVQVEIEMTFRLK